MRYYEIQPITEIERLSSDDFEGLESYDEFYIDRNTMKPRSISGSPNLAYKVYEKREGKNIVIYVTQERHQPVAVLNLLSVKYPGTNNAYKVDYISVDEKYRKMGLGKQLYNIALMPEPNGLGITLLSGLEQTPGGRLMWRILNSTPNIEVLGYMRLYGSAADDGTAHTAFTNERFVDDLFGKVGAYHIGSINGRHYFQFPVNNENENPALGSLIRVYGDDWLGIPGYEDIGRTRDSIGLVAKYLG